jgi:hypothetical protein
MTASVRPDGRASVVAQHRAWQRSHPIADRRYVNLADIKRIAQRNQLAGFQSAGV